MSLDSFDDLISKYDFLVKNVSVTDEFIRFVTVAEENRILWISDKREMERVKDELRATQNQLSDLEYSNDRIRRMFDKEKKARLKAEQELEQKVNLIQEVMEKIVSKESDKISEETKLQLSDIKNSFRRKERPPGYQDNGRLSMISEGETSSIISDISYSEDNLSEDNVLEQQQRRSVRKSNRRSSLRSSDLYSKVSRRSDQFKNVNLKQGDKVTATSTITFNQNGGVATASTCVDVSPPRKSRRTSQVIIPSIEVMAPSAPLNSASTSVEDFLAGTENDNDNDIQMSPKICIQAVDQIHGRIHSTLSHKCIFPVVCVVCNKRMPYTSNTVKCSSCKVIVHALCESKLPLPCVPVGYGTPAPSGKKHHLNVLASYTPAESPMIPALIIHCVLEVERRGFSEEGIYRKSGNPDQVKELKKELLSTESKHKLTEHIYAADIHSVCSTLKDFLRGLDEPLIPNSMWGWFTEATSTGDSDDINARLIAAIAALPQPNKETLAYLILHLQRVAEYPDTKMSFESISIIFGPSIIGYSSKNPVENCTEVDMVNRAVLHLLNLDSYYWNSVISTSVTNIQTTPTSFKSVPHTPSTDSLVYRGIGRRATTPKLPYSEKKKYFKQSAFRF